MSDERKPRTYGVGYSEKPEDPTRCIEFVHLTHSWGMHQCSRKRGHGEGGFYCAQHDPARVKAKQEEATARWQERSRREMQPYYDCRRMRQALDLIASGHNDPRMVARLAIEQTGEKLVLPEDEA